MQDLRIAMLQESILPNNPQANLEHFARSMSALHKVDLVILPEVFTTGFCAGARHFAEQVDGTAYQWMAEQAQRLQAVVTGSLVVKVSEGYVNRLVWMRPNGTYAHYDKRHLFRMAGEHTRYAGGKERVVVELHGWKILLLVCYDLRFPVWSRNRNDYDAILCVANWPAARAAHWDCLLRARAIENLSYVVGVNRVGRDEKQQEYTGGSAVFDPFGNTVIHSQRPGCLPTVLDAQLLKNYRTAFPAHLDADEFRLLL
jgi:omega-amidase